MTVHLSPCGWCGATIDWAEEQARSRHSWGRCIGREREFKLEQPKNVAKPVPEISSVEVEALVDEGYDKADIERELGVVLCRVDDCFEVSEGAVLGPYAGLCAKHTRSKREVLSANAREKELERRAAAPVTMSPVEYESSLVEESRNGVDPDSPVNQDEELSDDEEDAPEVAPQLAARRERREHRADDRRIHSRAMSGPAKEPEKDFRSASGRPVSIFDGFGEPERDRWIRTLSQLEREDELLDVEIEAMRGGNAKPAVKTTSLVMSRGAKVKRLAEALARLQDRKWWDMSIDEKRRYVQLADRAMRALELVEYETHLIQYGARLDRERLERLPQ